MFKIKLFHYLNDLFHPSFIYLFYCCYLYIISFYLLQ